MEKRPFIIDCDTGTDDAIAILAALYSPEVELKAITCVNGNICHDHVCRNNRNLMAYLGKDVPVAKGAVRPLLSGIVNNGHDDDTHGPTGLGTVILPEAEERAFDRRIASELIYETAVEEKGALELLVVGPMTNIALALIQHGDLAGLIRHIWFMGGAAVGGNVTPTAEFNIWVDPEAAHIVTQSGIPMTMVGLDVTTKAVMTREDADALRALGNREGQVAADLLEYMFNRNQSGGEAAMMHDALALAAAVCPECLECRDYFVDVEYRGQYAAGHTFVDRRGRTGKAANMSVALSIDVPLFRKWLVDTISRSAGKKMSGSLMLRDRRFYANIFALAFPIMLQQLLRISVDTVNSILLGSIDQLQMSAVSQADQVFFIYYTVCNGLAVGCCVLVAQYWGRRDVESIRTVLATGLRASAVFGLVATALVMAFPTLFMRLYSNDGELIALGAGYLRLVALMYLPCALSVMIFAGCRGVEQVKVVLVTNIISYSVNILLNYCLLYGRFGFPELGITGIAVGAVTARLVELAICGTYLLRMEKRIGFRLVDLGRKDRQLSRDIVKVSGPIVAHEMIWSMGTSTGSMITGQLGTSVVAGYNVMMVLYNLCASVGNGYLNACSVVIAKTIGGGDRELVKRQAKTMLITGLGIGFLLGGITLGARGPFLSLYNLEPDAMVYARQFMAVIAVIWPFSMLEMTGMIGILRAGGDGKTGFYSDIVIMWMVCIPLAALAAFWLKVPAAAVVAIVKTTIALEAIVGVIRVLSMRWIRDLTQHQ